MTAIYLLVAWVLMGILGSILFLAIYKITKNTKAAVPFNEIKSMIKITIFFGPVGFGIAITTLLISVFGELDLFGKFLDRFE
jgi:hypothetical protein